MKSIPTQKEYSGLLLVFHRFVFILFFTLFYKTNRERSVMFYFIIIIIVVVVIVAIIIIIIIIVIIIIIIALIIIIIIIITITITIILLLYLSHVFFINMHHVYSPPPFFLLYILPFFSVFYMFLAHLRSSF